LLRFQLSKDVIVCVSHHPANWEAVVRHCSLIQLLSPLQAISQVLKPRQRRTKLSVSSGDWVLIGIVDEDSRLTDSVVLQLGDMEVVDQLLEFVQSH
jgi:hypothetical protein